MFKTREGNIKFLSRIKMRLKDLNAVIFSIANQNIAVRHDCNSFEPFEFAVSTPPASEWSEKSTVRMENLYTIVPWITNKNITLIIYRHTPIRQEPEKQTILNSIM